MASLMRIVALCLALGLAAADDEVVQPDPPSRTESDFVSELYLRAQFEEADFMFNFNEAEPEAETPGGNLRPSLVQTNPFLGTLPGEGNGQNLVTLEACGVNQPHHHPRGTETSFIVKGELLFGLVEENGGRSISTNVTQGTSVSIPQGLIHFAQNLGCEQAQFLANFPTRDPGTATAATSFAMLPRSVIRGTLLVDDDVLDTLLASIESSENPSIDPVCAARCGLGSGGYGDE